MNKMESIDSPSDGSEYYSAKSSNDASPNDHDDNPPVEEIQQPPPVDHNYMSIPQPISEKCLGAGETGSEISSKISPERQTRDDVNDLPPYTVVIEGPRGDKTYIIGTAHFSKESEEDVQRLIRIVQPDIVAIELCISRRQLLFLDEEKLLRDADAMDFNHAYREIKRHGFMQGMMQVLFYSVTAQITRELGTLPGAEFRAAAIEAAKIGARLVLADRRVDITLRRALRSLSVWHLIKLFFQLTFTRPSITKEELEKYKQTDLLEEMVRELAGEFPSLSKVFIDERDLYLAKTIHTLVNPVQTNGKIMQPVQYQFSEGSKPPVLVAVVGSGHLAGIKRNWEKVVGIDLAYLNKIPEPSRSQKIAKVVIRTTGAAFAAWCFYKAAKLTHSLIIEKL